MAQKLDLLGKRFNRIVIIEYLGILNQKTYWKYKCDCGTIKSDYGNYINAGRIPSCGCLKREKISERTRYESGQSAKNRLIAIYKKRARIKNFIWSLTDEQFFLFISLPCHYCGVLPFNTTEKISPHSYGHIVFNGIDRVDSNKGYEEQNCVPCCHNCNLAKCDYSYDEFMIWMKRLINFQLSKK